MRDERAESAIYSTIKINQNEINNNNNHNKDDSFIPHSDFPSKKIPYRVEEIRLEPFWRHNMIYGMQFEPKLLLKWKKKYIQIIFPIYTSLVSKDSACLAFKHVLPYNAICMYVYGRCPHVSSFSEAGCIVLHDVNWIKHNKLHDVIWVEFWIEFVHHPLEMPKYRNLV